ncbi:CHY-type/CTCHY-type/RING-type Zinc finger protein [Zea mays]|uniref:CHY-type/CTCHY-type/RING-type Zinc finger protein n=1 Tax=Zea mays TaxID=4577 RepID=A0A1D6JNI9_MAIZE|nr:CHY-type/CTCHY-type/RING-type Zinc finger protein [Zea mays]ONL93607.1 CHY-type/CTCHY-type/RING-type Zinc finger protein [Zea mays]
MDGDAGPEQHGCVHYRRGCKIRAPCCGEVFGCRHCHNEAKDSLEVSVHDRHVLPRHDIKLVICSLCNKEQDVSSLTKQGQCSSATVGVTCHTPHEKKNPSRLSTGAARLCELRSMSRQILLREMQLLRRRCKLSPPFFDVLSEVADGILRANLDVISEVFPLLFSPVLLSRSLAFQVSKNQFHCDGCGICRQDWWRREFLSLWQMWFSCPVCLRSACNMSDIWQKLDQQVAASPMPAIYQKKMVWILCNDCGVTSNVQFHILAHKCPGCSSYNTRQTRGDPAACSRV